MAFPAIPTNIYLWQGNGTTYLQWSIVAGATSYSVQRSTDGVNFTTVGTPSVNNYQDTSVSIGTLYYYQIASTNGSGTSPYAPCSPTSIVPTKTAEMSLAEVIYRAQQRADRVNSNFVTPDEWVSYVNQSYFELYDILVTIYEEYYVAPYVTFITDGTTFLYPLPDGTNYNGAPALYKLKGIDLGLETAQNAFVTINRFQFQDRNRFVYPNTASTIYGVFNLQYRMLGNNIMFIPTPEASQPIRLWYAPRLAQLVLPTDVLLGISGWSEYVIVDAAIKALEKEESDTTLLVLQKEALRRRIEEAASNRDEGQPDRVTDIRGNGYWGSESGGWGWSGPIGGY